MSRLDANLTKLAVMILPPALRRGVLKGIVTAAASALDYAQTALYTFHLAEPTGTRYRVRHNSQVCKMRGVLNDTFDPDQRRIQVGVEAGTHHTVTYFDSETESSTYLRTYTYSKSEDGQTAVTWKLAEISSADEPDISIVVPSSLSDYDTAICAVVEKYKLVGKSYDVIYQ